MQNGTAWTKSGAVKGAISLDGTNDYVETKFGSMTSSMTISFWAKVTSYGADAGDYSAFFDFNSSYQGGGLEHFTNGAPGSRYIKFWGYYNGGASVQLDKSISSIDGDENAFLNKWHHYSVVVNPGDNRLYIDGKLAATSTLSTPILFQESTTLSIGRKNNLSRYLNGSVDEFKIYPYALTSSEIKAEYNKGGAIQLGTPAGPVTANPPMSFGSSQEYCIPGDATSCSAPVAEYKFDENRGTTANDTSGNGNNGAITGATYKDTGCKNGSCLSFDGINDYSQSVDSSSLQLSTSGTVSLWAYPTAYSTAGTWKVLIDKGNWGGGKNDYSLYFDGASSFCYMASGPTISQYACPSNTIIPLNQYTFITLSWDSTKVYLYLNGALYSSINKTENPNTAGYNLSIGGISGSYPFSGQIDGVRIYNYARTPAQIAWDYNKGAPIAHYKFDECQGVVAHDVSGNGNNGDITIGATGTQTNTSAGNCDSGLAADAWSNGATGKLNASMNFDGTDDNVDMGDPASGILDPGLSDFTLSAWIKTSVNNTSQVVAGKYYNYPIYYMKITNGVLYSRIAYSAGALNIEANDGTSLADANWHHVVTIFDRDGQMKRFVDGKAYGIDTDISALSASSISSSYNFIIGSGSNLAQPFSGQIDDVRIYNYALTASQIKEVYNDGAVSFK